MWEEAFEKFWNHFGYCQCIKPESQRWEFSLVVELSKGNLKVETCFSMQPFNQTYLPPSLSPAMLFGILAFSFCVLVIPY